MNSINDLTKNQFCEIFGNVFEKSAWIAEKVYRKKPFLNYKNLINTFHNVYENCIDEQYIKIFKLHPELAIEKVMTQNSKSEQKKARLNTCTKEELNEFRILNKKYKKKFGFPFIIKVAGKNKKKILKEFKNRIKNNINIEFSRAKVEVKKIATLRIKNIQNENF